MGSDAKEEAEAARVKAQSLLKETRARLNGHNRVAAGGAGCAPAACDALGCADTYVRNKPWHSVGAAAAVGVFIGVLLNLRR
ncbi:membrane protein [Klebsiella pneumoniae]|uniref:Membrane protein n=1 Tax=Klebsiella pneumoniae TaxID=573 RepID=A0A2X1RFV7_KLEPN|nr:membrane protein [Klebsiella pneumoniae]